MPPAVTRRRQALNEAARGDPLNLWLTPFSDPSAFKKEVIPESTSPNVLPL